MHQKTIEEKYCSVKRVILILNRKNGAKCSELNIILTKWGLRDLIADGKNTGIHMNTERYYANGHSVMH